LRQDRPPQEDCRGHTEVYDRRLAFTYLSGYRSGDNDNPLFAFRERLVGCHQNKHLFAADISRANPGAVQAQHGAPERETGLPCGSARGILNSCPPITAASIWGGATRQESWGLGEKSPVQLQENRQFSPHKIRTAHVKGAIRPCDFRRRVLRYQERLLTDRLLSRKPLFQRIWPQHHTKRRNKARQILAVAPRVGLEPQLSNGWPRFSTWSPADMGSGRRSVSEANGTL